MSARDAQKLAYEQDLDLVKIAPQATPPVCRIMDYGKYCFEQQKREKEAKKNQKVVSIKENGRPQHGHVHFTEGIQVRGGTRNGKD